MYGSSASNGYDSGGTENATGFSSRVEFESELLAVPARNKPGAEFPAPSIPAPTIPVFNKNLRRSMGTPAVRRANRPARRIIPLVSAGWERGQRNPPSDMVPGFPVRHFGGCLFVDDSSALLLDARERPSRRFRDDHLPRSRHPLHQTPPSPPLRP